MAAPEAPMTPLAALERVVYLMDRSLAPAPKVKAFANAAEIVAGMDDGEIERRAATGTLTELAGIGASTAAVISQAAEGRVPDRVAELEATTEVPLTEAGGAYRDALRGDCHSHSLWSDGGASIETMARTAQALGHDYLVLTDHSPRLTVAHGLNAERLRAQLEEVAALNEDLAPFRILTGIEVDILEDGSLDQDLDLLAELDVVVASAHSKLRMDRDAMTRRLVLAVASPHVDILGHCTGRKLKATPTTPPDADVEVVRKQSEFDPEIVFAACARFDTAVEINCRPERQDPPDELLEMALEWDCKISIDTDAHAPGQLEWQRLGCNKAAVHEIDHARIVNTWSADELVDWAGTHPTE
jgi:putative hydrolase